MPFSRSGTLWRTLLISSISLWFWGSATAALAGGPRWFTGPPFYTGHQGYPVVFFTTAPLYFTDPGELNAHVSHAQADALVAAAAAVWNVPTSSLTLAQGGLLAEHVSGGNVYSDGARMVFPADLQASNYQAKPIAIVYDEDGSVIDTLLGAGASEPSSCRQNGVLDTVDGFDPAGYITHAMLVLNGRCVGANADQLLQMQYQLARKFGRVLGLAWSQLNDNLFTGASTPNSVELGFWPLMHPIDVVCGTYTYKCMPQPFTLRPDDLSALAAMYPVTSDNQTAGKQLSLDAAMRASGVVRFPTGQGMGSYNIVARRTIANGPAETGEVVSATGGVFYRQNGDNPVTGPAVGPLGSAGMANSGFEGVFSMGRIPLLPAGIMGVVLTSEPINPLYTGDYALMQAAGAPSTPSGAPITYGNGYVGQNFWVMTDVTATGAAGVCAPGNDGVETAPLAADPSGWWTGQICADGHASWGSQAIAAGRSWTLEVTALDENGVATAGKLHPILGLWNTADAAGTLPTVQSVASAFNGLAAGTTQMRVPAGAGASALRFAIVDDRAHGRPDFAYKARLLYAAAVAPALLSGAGGQITVAGKGFRVGNRVTVNGVAATVLSWTATSLVATAPSRVAAKVAVGAAADVTVLDPGTGATTTMTGALTYDATVVPDTVAVLAAPVRVETGIVSATPFTVRVLAPDGATPLVGAGVRLAVASGSGTLAACGAAVCVLNTDARGTVSSTLTATAAGMLTLTATETGGSGATASVSVTAVDPVRTVTTTTASHYLAAGAATSWTFRVSASQDGLPAAGVAVAWTATGPGVALSSTGTATDAAGAASVTVTTTGLASGAVVGVSGCAWNAVCASAPVYGIDPAAWTPAVVLGAGQTVAATATLQPVTVQVSDGAGHALEGAPVTVFQTVDAWEGLCPASGRCAAGPVLAKAQATAVSDAQGLLTITPLEVSGIASVVNIAVATGTQGFLSLALVKTP